MPDPTERELLLVATELNEAARDITYALLQPAKWVESRNLRLGLARETVRKSPVAT